MYRAYTSTNKKGVYKLNGSIMVPIWQEQTIYIRPTITPLPTKYIDNNNSDRPNTTVESRYFTPPIIQDIFLHTVGATTDIPFNALNIRSFIVYCIIRTHLM